MSKSVWIINQYASTPSVGMGGRHYYLSRELAQQGYSVYLIASSSNHLLREQQVFEDAFNIVQEDGFKFVWVNMPQYKEAHSVQRAINWFLFPFLLQKLPKVITERPDAILCSSPSPVAFLGAQRLAKKFKARLVFEVRDIWPLTLTEIGGYSSKHPFIRLLQWIEDRAYRDSDRVISNLKNSVEHMESRGMKRDKFTWIPNGFSIDEVELNTPLDSDVLGRLPLNKFIVGYTGTLGVANAMNTLVEAACLLRNHRNIAFVFVGTGKEKNELKKLADSNSLSSIHFFDPIKKVEIPAMLARFDVCYIGWLDDPIYRFGIGANKIPEYLYSGKPIVHAYSGACDPIQQAGAGIQVPAGDAAQVSNAILRIYKMSVEERKSFGERGRAEALSLYEYKNLSHALSSQLFD